MSKGLPGDPKLPPPTWLPPPPIRLWPVGTPSIAVVAFLVLVGLQLVELLVGCVYLWAALASDPGPPGFGWPFVAYLGVPIALLALAVARSPRVRLVRRVQVLAASVMLGLAMIAVIVTFVALRSR